MYYLKDNKTGNEFEISLFRISLLRVSYPISFLLYGIGVASVLNIFGVQYEAMILTLAAAYALELLLRFANKMSGAKILFMVSLVLILGSVLKEIADPQHNHRHRKNPRHNSRHQKNRSMPINYGSFFQRFISGEKVAIHLCDEIERKTLFC